MTVCNGVGRGVIAGLAMSAALVLGGLSPVFARGARNPSPTWRKR